jgi:hypothetical protein
MMALHFRSFSLFANQPHSFVFFTLLISRHLAPDTHMPGESDILLMFSYAEAPGCTGKQPGPK